jgi:hypothetical protein
MKTSRFPKELTICGNVFPVLYFDKQSEVDIDGVKPLLGQVCHLQQQIRVYKGARPDTGVLCTIWHEALHAIAELLHVDLSEVDVDRLAAGITDVARQLRSVS